MPKRGYDEQHGNPGGALPAHEKRDAALPAEAGASLVPDLEELCDLNRRIHEDDELPERFALDQRAPLLGLLEDARAVDTTTPEGVVKVAALLAHGIAQAQAFRDGNRRTAFYTTQAFLERHGLGDISRGNDDILARRLNQLVERQSRIGLLRPPGRDKFEELFLGRLKNKAQTEGTK